MYTAMLFMFLLTDTGDIATKYRADNKINSIMVCEVKHNPKTVLNLKIVFEGKEYKVGQIIYTNKVDIKLSLMWNYDKKDLTKWSEAIFDLDLYEDGAITEYDFEIRDLGSEILFKE